MSPHPNNHSQECPHRSQNGNDSQSVYVEPAAAVMHFVCRGMQRAIKIIPYPKQNLRSQIKLKPLFHFVFLVF